MAANETILGEILPQFLSTCMTIFGKMSKNNDACRGFLIICGWDFVYEITDIFIVKFRYQNLTA